MSDPNQISCPFCGQGYAVTPEQLASYRGRTIPCTKCGKQFNVSASGEGVAPPALPPIPPPVPAMSAYAPPMSAPPPSKSGIGVIAILAIVAGVFFCLIVPLLIAILLPALNKVRQQAQQIKCGAILRQIGMACLVYANNSSTGEFPDSWQTLERSAQLDPSVLLCPAEAAAPQAGHISYVYCGKGLHTTAASAETVLAYEPLGNHNNRGMNVLYVDGHVQWLNAIDAQAMISHLPNQPQ